MPTTSSTQNATIFYGGYAAMFGALDAHNLAVYSYCKGAQGVESGKGRIAIKAVFKGREEYKINNQLVTLNAGEYIVLNEGQHCTFDYMGKENAEGFCLRIDSSVIHGVFSLQQNVVASLPVLHQEKRLIEQEPLGRYLQNFYLKKEYRQHLSFDKSLHFFHGVALALLQTKDAGMNGVQSIAGKKCSTRENIFERLVTAKAMMHDQVGSILNIGELAQKVCLSEYHFIRCFKQAFGTTPYHYHLSLRVAKAAELIQSSHGTLSEVAHVTGFCDVAALNKAFKAVYGSSPTSFRKLKHIYPIS